MNRITSIALAPLLVAACAAESDTIVALESTESAHTAASPIRSHHLLVALEGGGAVQVNARTGAFEQSYATGANAFGAMYDRQMLNRGYVTDKGAGTLSMVDVESDRVVSTIRVGNGPQQAAVDTGALSRLYIPLSDDGKVAEVSTFGSQEGDPRYFNVARTLDLGPTSKPHVASMSPPGAGHDRTLWVSVQGSDPRVVAIQINWDERLPGHFTIARELRNTKAPRVIQAVADGAYATFMDSTALWFADAQSGTLTEAYVDTRGPGSDPAKQIEGVSAAKDAVAITHEGRTALVVLRGSGARLIKSCEIALEAKPYWVTLDPSARVAYVSLPDVGKVQAFDVVRCDSRALFTAAVGGTPKRMDLTGSRNDLTRYDWEEVLTCDEGAATVRVNPNERREIAIELRHEGAANWLRGGHGHPRGMQFSPDKKSMRTTGWTPEGIFAHGSFQEFRSTDEVGSMLRVFRDAGGLKVQTNTFRVGRAPVGGWQPEDIRESRNWWFSHCEVR